MWFHQTFFYERSVVAKGAFGIISNRKFCTGLLLIWLCVEEYQQYFGCPLNHPCITSTKQPLIHSITLLYLLSNNGLIHFLGTKACFTSIRHLESKCVLWFGTVIQTIRSVVHPGGYVDICRQILQIYCSRCCFRVICSAMQQTGQGEKTTFVCLYFCSV